MADLKESLFKQIDALELVQKKAIEDGDMAKVQETANTIISISSVISSLK
jgi:hypothetical protein